MKAEFLWIYLLKIGAIAVVKTPHISYFKRANREQQKQKKSIIKTKKALAN